MTRWTLAGCLLFSALCSASTESACTYTYTPIKSPFPDVDQTLTNGINDRGWIVGEYHDALGPHGFVKRGSDYQTIDLPIAGILNVNALGINRQGDVVGGYNAPTETAHGYLLHENHFTWINVDFPGATDTFPRGINAAGEIVGTYNGGGTSHGFVLIHHHFFPLDVPFSGAHDTAAFGLNDCGDIVGAYTGKDGLIHGFAFGEGRFWPIDVAQPRVTETQVYAINNRGQIAGTYTDGEGTHGFLWDHRHLTSLDAPQTGDPTFTVVLGLNDFGQIVGDYSGALAGFFAQRAWGREGKQN